MNYLEIKKKLANLDLPYATSINELKLACHQSDLNVQPCAIYEDGEYMFDDVLFTNGGKIAFFFVVCYPESNSVCEFVVQDENDENIYRSRDNTWKIRLK